MRQHLEHVKAQLQRKEDYLAVSAMELVISLHSDDSKVKVDGYASELFHLLAQRNGFSWGSYSRKLQNIARLAWRG